MSEERDNQSNQSTENKEKTTAQDSFERLKDFATNTEDTTTSFDPADIEKNKVVSAFAYFGILFFLPLIACAESRFGRFHANQGLLLLIVSMVGNTVLGIIPLIGWLLLPIFNLAVFILFLLGFLGTLQGKAKRLPIFGKYDLIK